MMAHTFWSADVWVFLLAIALAVYLRRKDKALMPPGPKGYPIIGNLLDLPLNLDWQTFSKWGETHGDLVSATVFGTTIVVINSSKRATEIFDRTNFSSRPYLALSGELLGFDQSMALLPFGNKSRNARKFFQKELGSRSRVENFHSQELQQTKTFIRRVLNSPEDLFDHVFHHSASIVLRIAYGYEPQEKNDRMLRIGKEAMEGFNESLLPDKFLCNQIPILRHVPAWVPGAGFQKLAAEWRKMYNDMTQVPFQYTKAQMTAGTAEESVVAKWLRTDMTSTDQEELMHTAGAMYGAGGETTGITVYMLFIILAQFPEIQARAKAEVDSAVGRDRLPNFEDRGKLPYLEALTKEIMRWHPVLPMGLPHVTLEDDMVDDYFIPKGAMILGNIKQMCHDPVVYKNHQKFNPDRFLGENPEADPRLVFFGFGRRVCPGRFLADASLFITYATIIWSFDVSSITVDGKLVPPVISPKSGAVSHLEPVKLNITPRSDKLEERVSPVSNSEN